MIVKFEDNYKQELINLGSLYDKDFKKKYLTNLNKIYLFIKHNHVVGFLIYEDTIDESSLILLYVEKNMRNQKIGSLLLDYYISGIRSNIKRIILEVSKNNKIAISLYNKFDFNQVGIRKKYYQDGSDAIIMERSCKYE